AASAVSETAYELGAALGIALLGSIVTSIYQGFVTPAGVPEPAADAARSSLGGAVETVGHLPADQGATLLKAAQDSFVSGVDTAAGIGAVVLLGAAVAAWFLLRGQSLADSAEPEPAADPEAAPMAGSGTTRHP
ncbi:MFS transporter, partial [Streptomyces noursei]